MPPTSAEKHVPAFDVKVDGTKIDNTLAERVLEIRVRDSLRVPKSALVRISDPQMKSLDSHPFELGARLQISMNAIAATAGTGPVLFDGEIVSHEPEFEKDGVSIVVRAYDKSHRLQRGKKVRTFQQVSASDIVKKIGQEAGLSVGGDSTSFVHEYFQQSDETDRELIRRLEILNDFEFVQNGSATRFDFRRASHSDGEVELKYTEQLTTFRPRLSAVQQVKEVEVRGWDVKAKKEIVGSASSGEDPAAIGVTRASVANKFTSGSQGKSIVVDHAVTAVGEANALAKAALDRRAAQVVEAEGTCLGNPNVRAGKDVKLTGLGAKFSGRYHVTAVTHVYRTAGSGYQTHFTVSGRSDRGLLDLMHPPKERHWSEQLVVGIVTNNKDPDNLGRVRVKYPALTLDEESAWARVLTHSAGANGRGIFMLPQVNDEVVVAFENGDTRRPLIIGSVYNGIDKPVQEILPDQKGGFSVVSLDRGYIHTKEDFTIKSDKKMIVEVTTDQTAKVDGKREETITGNVTQKTNGSAELKAASSYTIEAGSSVTIKGTGSVTVESSGSLKLKGATVDIESQGPATLKGAIVDINASGIANLKGSMVNIG